MFKKDNPKSEYYHLERSVILVKSGAVHQGDPGSSFDLWEKDGRHGGDGFNHILLRNETMIKLQTGGGEALTITNPVITTKEEPSHW